MRTSYGSTSLSARLTLAQRVWARQVTTRCYRKSKVRIKWVLIIIVIKRHLFSCRPPQTLIRPRFRKLRWESAIVFTAGLGVESPFKECFQELSITRHWLWEAWWLGKIVSESFQLQGPMEVRCHVSHCHASPLIIVFNTIAKPHHRAERPARWASNSSHFQSFLKFNSSIGFVPLTSPILAPLGILVSTNGC